MKRKKPKIPRKRKADKKGEEKAAEKLEDEDGKKKKKNKTIEDNELNALVPALKEVEESEGQRHCSLSRRKKSSCQRYS